jgi:DNA-binding MarR family transcriptional regulator
MEKHRVHPDFYLSLLDFLMTAKQHLVSIGAEFGLTSIQAVTLMLIDEARPRPMKNFCTLFHCDASNITGIVDGLEQKGLVSRQNSPTDRRVKTIQLEQPGKRMQEQIIERLASDNDFLFAALTDDETRQFVHIVEKLAATKKSA